jgi:riboflavin kinase/FMN adenylyltransferase
MSEALIVPDFELLEPEPRAVALGTFDGVHLGHQRVVRTAIEHARLLGARSAVATFHPRPVSVIVPDRAPESLGTLDRRLSLLSAAGPDDVVVVRFTPALAELSPERFADEVLVGRFGAVEILVGQNFRFGKGRRGDVNMLRALGEIRGFGVTVTPLHEIDGAPVSSSRIRDLIRRGDVEGATRLLGRPPSMEGVVIRGDGRGRELGVPTANLGLEHGFVQPAEGVYAGDVVLGDGRRFRAAISVGTNPTFDGVREIRVESHILRFDEDIYGVELRVEFRRFLRGQWRFESIDELIHQMREDIAACDVV